MESIGFIGGGNMAQALIKGIIKAKVYKPRNIFVSDIKPERLAYLSEEYGIQTVSGNKALAGKVDTLVLSVKPQIMAAALGEIKDAVRTKTLIISIAAGKRIAAIEGVLGDAAIVRVMPNTPALIGEGASALFANEKGKSMLDKAKSIFSAVGKTIVVENEDLIDAVTAVSGSGPAYYFLLMEEMIKAAVKLGLSENAAKELVLQTARGAALLAIEGDKKGESPAVLRQKVTSPGGTTEAALKVLADGKLGILLANAIEKACERSRELSK
jgi:pyrroline-5-carboxylate reductase